MRKDIAAAAICLALLVLASAVARAGDVDIDSSESYSKRKQTVQLLANYDSVDAYEEYGKRIQAAQEIAPLSSYPGIWNTGWSPSEADSKRDQGVISNAVNATCFWQNGGGGC